MMLFPQGKKCCVFPFLPYTERDEKRSFLPAGGKILFCIRGQKTRVFVTVFGVLGTFFHHFCRGRDEKSSFHPVPYKSGEKSSFHPLVVVYIFFQPRQFRFFFEKKEWLWDEEWRIVGWTIFHPTILLHPQILHNSSPQSHNSQQILDEQLWDCEELWRWWTRIAGWRMKNCGEELWGEELWGEELWNQELWGEELWDEELWDCCE